MDVVLNLPLLVMLVIAVASVLDRIVRGYRVRRDNREDGNT